MGKYIKRVLTILAILVLGVVICIPVLGEGADDPKVASDTTVKTSDLFYAYPYHLKAKNQAYATGMEYFSDYQLIFAYEQATNAIYDISSEDEAMMTVITSLKNGVEYTFWELGSALGLTGDFESNAADRATQQLLAATIQNEGILSAIVEENEAMQAAWESIKNADDFMSSGTFSLLSNSEKKMIQDALDEKSDVLDAVDTVVTAAEVGAYICFMEQVDTVVINYIRSCTDNSVLSSSLYSYSSHKNYNYRTYIIDKYISETTIELMSQAIQKGLSHVGTSAGALFTAVDLIFEATGTGLSWATGFGTNEDLVVSMMLDSYVNDFISTRTDLINKFLTEPVLPSMIEDYKNAYMFYAISVRALAESVKDVNKAHEELMDYAVGNIDEYVSFEAHLDGCKLAVENTPVEERKVVKGNPELYYSIYGGNTKISDASDTIEDDTIYYVNGELYYGLMIYGDYYACEVEFAQLETPGTRTINGDLMIYTEKAAHLLTKITIPENLQLNVLGDFAVTDMDASKIEIFIDGALLVSGDYYETGERVNDDIIYLQKETSVFEVAGDVSSEGKFSATKGKTIFRGSNVYAPGVRYCNGTVVEISTDGCGSIDLGDIEFDAGTEPINIDMFANHSMWTIKGTAKGHTLSTDSDYATYPHSGTIKITDELLVENIIIPDQSWCGKIIVDGSMIVENTCNITEGVLDIGGHATIKGDCQIEGRYIGEIGTNLNVTGTAVVEGDCGLECGITVSDFGLLKINGDFYKLDGEASDFYLKGEAPILEFAGNVKVEGDLNQARWFPESGKIIFSGNKVSVPTLGRIADTTIEIRTEGTEAVDIGLFDLTAGTEPINIDISYKDEVYYVNGTASGHTIITDQMQVCWINENNAYSIGYDYVTIHVTDELVVGSAVLNNTYTTVKGVMVVEDDLTVLREGNCSTFDLEGILKVNGDFTLDDWFFNLNGTIIFSGTEEQVVDIEQACFGTIILENTSEAGVTFLHWFEMTGLFNHNRNNFTLPNGCMTIDYDGDGLNDEVDLYPADASLPADITINYECVELNIPEGSSVYTGEPIYPIVTVTLAGKVLTENVDYTVQHLDNVNAGTGKVVVTAIDPYLGRAEVWYQIGKAEPVISVTDNWNYTTDTESFTLDASLIKGDGVLTYESTNEDVLTVDEHGVVTINKVGSAIIWIRVEETTNYQATVVGTSITIDRGTIIEGDYDDNRVVNSNDAIYLLYHTIMPRQYPIYQDADYDRNGVVNSNDAIQLLYDIMLSR